MSNQFYGTGRRKSAVARVRLLPGQGTFTINGKDIEEYFGYETLKELAKSPLQLTEKLGQYLSLIHI